jgi:hypothetical protein
MGIKKIMSGIEGLRGHFTIHRTEGKGEGQEDEEDQEDQEDEEGNEHEEHEEHKEHKED